VAPSRLPQAVGRDEPADVGTGCPHGLHSRLSDGEVRSMVRTQLRGSPSETAAPLTIEERGQLLQALRLPRGLYSAARAAQLSGVPERTVYHWARHEVLTPDHVLERPKSWSYRDLVYLRLTAFLRSHDVDLCDSTALVSRLRAEFSLSAENIQTEVSAASGGYALGPTMEVDELSGQTAFETMVAYVGTFDILAPLEEKVTRRLWGPNLIRPSTRTSMSPWVMSGEPVVRNSRIPTASLHALHEDRQLSAGDIVALYPTISLEDVSDAIDLEARLRSAA